MSGVGQVVHIIYSQSVGYEESFARYCVVLYYTVLFIPRKCVLTPRWSVSVEFLDWLGQVECGNSTRASLCSGNSSFQYSRAQLQRPN